jgi:NADPH-dependent glutamate synthase beta subunit-like oxidoreductase
MCDRYAQKIGQGNFSNGFQILKKSLPFPAIISRICDQPCRNVCLRDKSIAIADLERACVDFGNSSEEKPANPIKRKQRVAIIGGGLSGLTAAFDLTRKRYEVSIYEANGILGGRIRSIPENQLPRSIVDGEIDALIRLGVEVHYNTLVSTTTEGGHITLDQLRRENDAVYIATGGGSQDRSSFDLEQAGLGKIDLATRATSVNAFSPLQK